MLGTKKAMRKVFFFFSFFFFFSSVRIALLTSSFKVWITQDFMEKGWRFQPLWNSGGQEKQKIM